jgi:hypothetical protein
MGAIMKTVELRLLDFLLDLKSGAKQYFGHSLSTPRNGRSIVEGSWRARRDSNPRHLVPKTSALIH